VWIAASYELWVKEVLDEDEPGTRHEGGLD
jgi:hypothetical protein